MITSIKVDNFKSLVDFSIDFKEMTVIVGDNSAGKSTVLQALEFLFGSVRDDFKIILERRNWKVENIKSKLKSSNKINFEVHICLEDENRKRTSYLWRLTLLVYKEKNWISLNAEEIYKEDEEKLLTYQEGKGGWIKGDQKENDVSIPAEKAFVLYSSLLKNIMSSKTADANLLKLTEYINSCQSFELLSPDSMRQSSRGKVDSIGMSGKDLPAFLKNMDAETKADYMEKMTYVLRGRIGDVQTATKKQPGWTEIVAYESYPKNQLAINSKELSDGMLRILSFAAIAEMESKERTMLLDEIENGVNIDQVERLVILFKELYDSKKFQIITTTHSTFFLDYMDPESIVYMYRDEEGKARARTLFEINAMKKKLAYMSNGEAILNTTNESIIQWIMQEEKA